MRKAYAKEIDGKVMIHCKNPRFQNLVQFWNEVFDYFKKGYTLYEGSNRKWSPIGMGQQRITLIPPSNTEEVIVAEEVETPKVVKTVKRRNKTK